MPYLYNCRKYTFPESLWTTEHPTQTIRCSSTRTDFLGRPYAERLQRILPRAGVLYACLKDITIKTQIPYSEFIDQGPIS
jgi:hypothetical protein